MGLGLVSVGLWFHLPGLGLPVLGGMLLDRSAG